MPTFGKIQQSLRPNDRVVLGNLNSEELDGATGEVVGVGSDGGPYSTSYLILLDVPLKSGWKAVHIVESCIDRV